MGIKLWSHCKILLNLPRMSSWKRCEPRRNKGFRSQVYTVFIWLKDQEVPFQHYLECKNQPIKYKNGVSLPKQTQKSRSVLSDGSRFFGSFWKKKLRLITEEIQHAANISYPARVCAQLSLILSCSYTTGGGGGEEYQYCFRCCR